MVEGNGPENRHTGNRIVGSNPTPTANWEDANLKKSARGARRAARIEFERVFFAKRKRIYQSRAKEIFSS